VTPSRALFVDRDDTLIHDPGYLNDPDLVRFLDGAIDALRAIDAAGFRIVIISNQSGVGRGLITPEQQRAVHGRVAAELADAGITLAGAYYCPHLPDAGCDCRKPEPGMILRAAAELGLDLPGSFMVGDKPSDVEAGERAGVTAIHFTGSWPAVLAAIGTVGSTPT
jgi:D-glycero-D-manno-heptose 1,7-bisphosphate phosphatase